MWKNAPTWVVILRDVACLLVGLGALAFLIFTRSTNAVAYGAALSLTGVPGLAAAAALVLGSKGSTTDTSTPSSPSRPDSSSP